MSFELAFLIVPIKIINQESWILTLVIINYSIPKLKLNLMKTPKHTFSKTVLQMLEDVEDPGSRRSMTDIELNSTKANSLYDEHVDNCYSEGENPTNIDLKEDLHQQL